jgi:hypothetical protein
MLKLLSLTATILLLSTAAFGQESPAAPGEAAASSEATAPAAPSQSTDYRRVKDDDRMVADWSLKVDDVEDHDVVGPDGKELGEIEAVLENAKGEIRAVLLEYGGFLGFGAKQVIVPLDKLQPTKGKRFTTALTEEQLAALPAWTK